MVLHKSITLLWSNTKAIQYILGCMRVCIWSMVILYWHHHCFWLYCPFSTLTITPLCRAESKSDKDGTILLRYHSQYLLHTTAAALHAKRKCHYIRCAVGLVPFLCTEPAALFPSTLLAVWQCTWTSDNHKSCVTKYLPMWHNLMCCLLTEKQIWDRSCLIVEISAFCPLGNY